MKKKYCIVRTHSHDDQRQTGIQEHDGVERPSLRPPPELCWSLRHDGDRDGVSGLQVARVLPLDVQLGGRRRAEHLRHRLPVSAPAYTGKLC